MNYSPKKSLFIMRKLIGELRYQGYVDEKVLIKCLALRSNNRGRQYDQAYGACQVKSSPDADCLTFIELEPPLKDVLDENASRIFGEALNTPKQAWFSSCTIYIRYSWNHTVMLIFAHLADGGCLRVS